MRPVETEKGLPADVQVEKLVLGSCLLSTQLLDLHRSTIEPEDFSLDTHRKIWGRICHVYDAGEGVDTISVYSALKDGGEAEACGGLSYLTSLDEGLPLLPQVDTYVQILKDKALRRRIIFSAQNLMNRAFAEDQPVDEILTSFGEIETRLSQAKEDNRPVSTLGLIEKVGVDALLSPRRHGEIRLPWAELDRALSGFAGGQVVVLLGETSRGKTSFALQCATHAVGQGKTALIWTMEMSPRSLFRRLVTQLSGVPIKGKTSQLSFEERDSHRMAIAHLTDHLIYFDNRSRSVSSFCSSIRQVRSKGPLGLVVVDYIQLIRSNARQQSRAQQVSENSRNLKLAAMDFNIPMLVLSQVDRASVKGDGKIGLHSAKEAGDIENDADVLLWIESKQLSRDEPTPVSIAIGKQREGAAGFSIQMKFLPTSQTFRENDPETME